jgi:Zn ribbon nucleic-acid-binding protein
MQSYNVASSARHREDRGASPEAAMTTGSLLLFPADPDADPPAGEAVCATLGVLGLVGAALPEPATFLPGPEFARHVVFAGCSPHLVLEPPADGGAYSHVRVHGPHAAPRLLAGDNATAPRCPACRARLDDWRAQLAAWRADPAVPVACVACGRTHPASRLDWRASAAVGRLFVEIGNVFPGEAVPGETLLAALGALGGGAWRHAWVRGEAWRAAT